jgi:acetyltransferase-like isoleucine patch superfamily enzyme
MKSSKRGDFVRKNKIFGNVGKNVRLPQMIIPLRSENIFIGNNVEVASGVHFVVHDAIHGVFNNMPGNKEKYKEHIGKIEIGSNVFIGASAILISPVKIGDNVVVAAGAVVNKDVPSGSVVAGVPAKVIGSFEELKKKRLEYSKRYD